MAIVETTLYTTLRGSDEPIEELPAEIISYGFRLNRPGSINFALSLDHPKCRRDVIWPGIHEAVVERNKQVVWRGPVLTADETDEAGNRMVSFGGEGLLAYPNRWYLTADRSFSNTEQFTIARTLIDEHPGDFGIDTSGVNTSGVTRDRTYVRGKNIGEAILELAEVRNGFDFQVNPATRLLQLFYPQQGARLPDLIIEDGIRSYSRSIDATSQASQIIGLGEGEGADQVFIARQDSSAVAEYGLTQAVYSDAEVSVQSTLDDHVRQQLAYLKNPTQDLQVTVGTDTFNPFSVQLGVELRVSYPSSYDPVREVRRLTSVDVRWEQGDERAVLGLSPIVNL